MALGAVPTLCVLMVWLAAAGQPPLVTAELASLDLRYRLRGPIAPSDHVALAVIDDRSLETAGTWPLPRQLLADAVTELDRLGAAVIAFDLLLPARPGGEEDAEADGDRALAQALARAPGVVLPFALVWHRAEAAAMDLPEPVRRAAYRVVAGGPGEGAATMADGGLPPAAIGAVVPSPVLVEAATTLGHVTVLLAPDGALRVDRLVLAEGQDLYPSLSVEAVRLFDGLRRDRVVVHVGQGVAIGERFVPTDGTLGLAVNHYGPRATFPAWSMADLLDGRIPEHAVAGRIVVIGASAVGLGDTFRTPFTPTLPGAEHFATAIDNMLTGRWLDRGTAARASDLLGILLVGGLTAMAWRFPPPVAAALGLGVVLGWLALAQAVFVLGPVWIGVAGPVAAGVANLGAFAFAATLVERRRAEETERRRMLLARYLPAPLAERLADAEAPLPPRSTTATVMFIDLVGFTSLAEKLPAADAMALLRGFHGRVERAVLDRGGMLDKYIGDGALAAFGAMGPDPDAAVAALACARGLVADMAAWSAERQEGGGGALSVGIGLHTGSVLVGDVGGERQPQFTVIGDTVNVASRLQALTRDFGSAIVASDSTVDAARAVGGADAVAGLERYGPHAIRGREAPVGIWVSGP